VSPAIAAAGFTNAIIPPTVRLYVNRLAWPVRSGSPEYMKEELVAELGSAFLCVFLQLTPELRPAHASYIEQWLKMLRGDNRAIFAAAAHAQRAADYLLARQPPSPG